MRKSIRSNGLSVMLRDLIEKIAAKKGPTITRKQLNRNKLEGLKYVLEAAINSGASKENLNSALSAAIGGGTHINEVLDNIQLAADHGNKYEKELASKFFEQYSNYGNATASGGTSNNTTPVNTGGSKPKKTNMGGTPKTNPTTGGSAPKTNPTTGGSAPKAKQTNGGSAPKTKQTTGGSTSKAKPTTGGSTSKAKPTTGGSTSKNTTPTSNSTPNSTATTTSIAPTTTSPVTEAISTPGLGSKILSHLGSNKLQYGAGLAAAAGLGYYLYKNRERKREDSMDAAIAELEERRKRNLKRLLQVGGATATGAALYGAHNYYRGKK